MAAVFGTIVTDKGVAVPKDMNVSGKIQNVLQNEMQFKTAARVFIDPNKLIREGREHPEELRYDVPGKVGKILFAVCTLRERNSVRLISARIAAAAEKARHEQDEDDFE